MLPPTIRAGGRRSCSTAFATVVLPQPDSPASPTVSPSWIVRSTPSAARTRLAPVPYSTASCRSSRSAARFVRFTGGSSTRAVTRRPPRAPGAPPAGRRRASRAAAGAPAARFAGAGSQRQRLPAQDPGLERPEDERQDDGHGRHPTALQVPGGDDEERYRRDREEDVRQEVDDLVDEPARVGGGDPEDRREPGREHA